MWLEEWKDTGGKKHHRARLDKRGLGEELKRSWILPWGSLGDGSAISRKKESRTGSRPEGWFIPGHMAALGYLRRTCPAGHWNPKTRETDSRVTCTEKELKGTCALPIYGRKE
jgi:hypothetical protein